MRPSILAIALPIIGLGHSICLQAQTIPESSEVALPPITPKEWNRLRVLTQALATEDGSRKLFLETPGLSDAFASEEIFLAMISKWRPRISVLPEKWTGTANIEINRHKRQEDTISYFVTYYHNDTLNSITILKACWEKERLTGVSFLRGISDIPFDNANKIRSLDRQETEERAWKKRFQSPVGTR